MSQWIYDAYTSVMGWNKNPLAKGDPGGEHE